MTKIAEQESRLRRRLGVCLNTARRQQGLSVRELARRMGTSLSQVQRLLYTEQTGSLTLRTICRACIALDVPVEECLGVEKKR